MNRFRIKHLSVSILVTLSLFVSAVSACACSHHQLQEAAEKISCHSSSHDTPKPDGSVAANFDAFESGCSCFARTQSPAVISKSVDKRYKSQLDAIGSNFTAVSTEPIFFAIGPRIEYLENPALFAFGPPRAGKPARAPPIL